jgi:uncharacterized membrane protein
MADHTAAGPRRPGFRLSRGLTWRRWLIDILLIAGGIVSVIFEPFSIAIHSVIGLIFVGTVGPHLWHRRSWSRGTLSRLRQRRRLSARLRWSLSQAFLLLVLVVVMTTSGLYDWLDVRSRIRWHAISSIILIAVVARHAWTRRPWLLRRRRTGGP